MNEFHLNDDGTIQNFEYFKAPDIYKKSNNENVEHEEENEFDKNTSIKYTTGFNTLISPENEKTFSSEVEMAKNFSKMEISTEKKIDEFKKKIGKHYNDYENFRKTKKTKYVRDE
jgi:hypothetical protein